jgi:hypothetical protein
VLREGGRLLGRRLHHGLELGPAVVGGAGARLDILGDDPPALVAALGFELPALIRDRQVVLGLAAGRDPQMKGGALLVHDRALRSAVDLAEQR